MRMLLVAATISRVLLAGSAPMQIQRGFDAVNQCRASERLGKKANRSGLQCPGAHALFGKGRDKNKRRVVTLAPHMRQKVQATHSGHLHISNHAGRAIYVR